MTLKPPVTAAVMSASERTSKPMLAGYGELYTHRVSASALSLHRTSFDQERGSFCLS